MTRIVIVGYGNPLRGDDGVGWHAAERLFEENQLSQVEILTRHQLTPELAETLSHANGAVFIDASKVGKPGGVESRMLVPEASQEAFTHRLTPVSLLALTAELFDKSPTAYLVSITGQEFGLGESLSPTVNRAMPELVEVVKKLVAELKNHAEA